MLVSAKTRSIAIPGDLESQINLLFNTTVVMMKSTRQWLSRGKKKESIKPISKDYRNIIEGLQVRSSYIRHVFPFLCYNLMFLLKDSTVLFFCV